MSARLDDTLRHLARADAPADLSARVRVALETGSTPATPWPTLAAATLVALLVTGGWVVMHRAGGTSTPPTSVHESGTATPSAAVRHGGTSVPPTEYRRSIRATGSSAGASGTSARAGGTFSSAVAAAKAEVQPTTADHEHALPSLADIAAVGPAALSTPPMRVDATEIAPLAPIAAMEIPALDAGGGERR